jgi:transposase-like protein
MVRHYTPEFEKRWHRDALAVGQSWRVDETYIKIRGEWCYLYRAVDRLGRTVDFSLSARRDVAAAKAFFRKAIQSHQRPPQTITLDGYAASHRAVRELESQWLAANGHEARAADSHRNHYVHRKHPAGTTTARRLSPNIAKF